MNVQNTAVGPFGQLHSNPASWNFQHQGSILENWETLHFPAAPPQANQTAVSHLVSFGVPVTGLQSRNFYCRTTAWIQQLPTTLHDDSSHAQAMKTGIKQRAGTVANGKASKRPISFSSIHSSETISAPEGARDLTPCFPTHLMPLDYELQTPLVRCRPTQSGVEKSHHTKKVKKSNTIEISNRNVYSRSKSRHARTEPL